MNAQVPENWTSQEVRTVKHPRLGVIGAIVVDSTALGPAMGGCRLWAYSSYEDALLDGRRLARGMSYKNALAGLPMGGGKSVLIRPANETDRVEVFKAFADAVASFDGRYIAAEDVGTKVSDMELVRQVTPHVCGVSALPGKAGGDPSPLTARGVFVSIQAVAMRLGMTLAGLRVGVQGLGHVGYSLAQMLSDAGAELVVADINQTALDAIASELRTEVVPPGEIHAADVDIFAPCALGAIINQITIPEIRARAIVGAANNQLATEADGTRLQDRGVIYAPDYVVNAGGVINVAGEYFNETPEAVEQKVDRIGKRLLDILERAETLGMPNNITADLMAREAIRGVALTPLPNLIRPQTNS